ncbi:MAG: DNA repair protein RecN [Thermonemataceae bacterium]|nr:DNA repair protein RecN [Thermonemataceae bacterium]
MLKNLSIQNYALIERLELQPHQAFNVITGETGAGKSIMLGAIGLILGNRADKKVLFDEQEKCIVEALFDISPYSLATLFEEQELDYEENTVVRREIAANGKSRAFINDTPVNLEVLSKITQKLIDIHSQHDNLSLSAEDYQRYIVDVFAENQFLLQNYQETYKEYQKRYKHHQKLLNEQTEAQKEFDYNRFLLEELQKANFQADEQELLEQELGILENAEELKEKLSDSLLALQEGDFAILAALKNVQKNINKIAEYDPEYEQTSERIENILEELKDITRDVETAFEQIEYDAERISEIHIRLDELERLLKKHKVGSIQELLLIQSQLTEKVDKILNFDDYLSEAERELHKIKQELLEVAQKLSQQRKAALPNLEKEISHLFADLGMPNATLKIEMLQTEPALFGIDKISFLFSANKGIAPQEIKNVASGGEFSRLMLAIKYILAGKTAMPTLIFDEIDTGISGETALKMGRMMQEMAKNHQIITITHLHQIAAKGDKHYFVFKEDNTNRTFSRMRELQEKERIEEIAQMISGDKNSLTALQSAKELLNK